LNSTTAEMSLTRNISITISGASCASSTAT
jgi:hypothetical protein